MLASTPEGRSVVKLQRELEGMAQIALERGDRSTEMRPIFMVQKGVDSLMRVIVRQLNDNTSGASFVFQADSNARLEWERSLSRAQIEAHIRELQPRVAAMAGTVAAGGSASGRISLRRAPQSGWIGLRISGSFFRENTGAGVVTQYCDDYPVIEAVDPGSPGEKGGLLAGDTLIAFNHRDVLAHPIVHSQVFVPGQQLNVTFRRIGKTRNVPLTVAEPRDDARMEFTSPMISLYCPSGNCKLRLSTDSAFTLRGYLHPEPAGASIRTSTMRSMITPVAPPVPVVGMLTRETGMSIVGGAQVTIVGEELAQTLGLEQGLLVLRVLAGTPMSESGIRAGDVIRHINGARARDIASLQRAFSVQSREATLSVVAKDQPARAVRVKW